MGTLFGQAFFLYAITDTPTPEPVAHPPPDAIAKVPSARPIEPIQPMLLSVVASTPAHYLLFRSLQFILSQFYPISHGYLFSRKNIPGLILERPPPKPPHSAATSRFYPFSTSQLHNLYSYKLLG
jgi:hypothetical protein